MTQRSSEDIWKNADLGEEQYMNIYPGRKKPCNSKYLTDRLRNI
jgi:hypothetical protein